jgi:hypothetical protein
MVMTCWILPNVADFDFPVVKSKNARMAVVALAAVSASLSAPANANTVVVDIADDYAVMDRGAVVLAGTRETMNEEQVRGRMTV